MDCYNKKPMRVFKTNYVVNILLMIKYQFKI